MNLKSKIIQKTWLRWLLRVIFGIAVLWLSFATYYGFKSSTAIYAKTKIDAYSCPSEDCKVIESYLKGTLWELQQSLDRKWLEISVASGEVGYIKTSEITKEVPTVIYLQKPGRARACPSLDCESLGLFEQTGVSFMIFENDRQGEWYSIETFNNEDKERKIFTAYLNKSLFEKYSEEIQTPSPKKNTALNTPIVKKLPVPTPIEIPSGPPITLYAKTDIKAHKEPFESSEVVGEIKQFSYWEFPYTPKGDWYSVLTLENKPGYVKAIDLISEFPNHCSLELKYRVGRVDDFFVQKGFTGTKLSELLIYSEKQWEDALGKDIFRQDNNSPNTINFIVDALGEGSANAENHYGRLYHDKTYPNGTVERFTIKVFSELFTYAAQPYLLYYGEPTTQDKLTEAEVARVITHELGHALGLGHLDLEEVEHKESVMIGGETGGYATSYLPKLTEDDISLLKEFCNQTQ